MDQKNNAGFIFISCVVLLITTEGIHISFLYVVTEMVIYYKLF